MSISAQLLEKLACPCEKHGKLTLSGESLKSDCCAVTYKISGGTPILLPKFEEQA